MSISGDVAVAGPDTPDETRLMRARRPLTDCLLELAETDRLAFTFVDYAQDRAGRQSSLTWRELVKRVRAVAAEVSARTSPGDRVAILAPQNLDYVVAFLGALLAGRIAVPLFDPETNAYGARVAGAIADCRPTVWLTGSSALDSVGELAATDEIPAPEHILAVDRIAADAEDRYVPPAVELDAPAYLQYTSGSTGSPAGAVITHRAVATNGLQVQSGFGTGEDSTYVGWLPFFHDMGLMLLICMPVQQGAHAVFTTPFAFIRKPLRWLQMLAEHPNVISGGPNFAFDMAVKKVGEAERAELDLSGIRVLINGAEPVREPTIRRFAEAFGPCGFDPPAHRPSYGLAEATVFVATAAGAEPVSCDFDRGALACDRAIESNSEDAVRFVAAGSPIGQLVRIVDPAESKVLPDDAVGEIWVHGPNVAAAYWDSPKRTEETFHGALDEPELPPGPWLRTGDLGVYHDGLLYITGRIKDLIIIDGKNHYPQDIEATAQEAHPAIRKQHLAAFGVDDGAAEGAVLVAEAHPETDRATLDERELARSVKRAVSNVHDVKLLDVRLVAPGEVPRTSSGKIARAAARDRYFEAVRSEQLGH